MKYFVHFDNKQTWDREFGKLYAVRDSKSGEYIVDEQGHQMRVMNDPVLFSRYEFMQVEIIQ